MSSALGWSSALRQRAALVVPQALVSIPEAFGSILSSRELSQIKATSR